MTKELVEINRKGFQMLEQVLTEEPKLQMDAKVVQYFIDELGREWLARNFFCTNKINMKKARQIVEWERSRPE